MFEVDTATLEGGRTPSQPSPVRADLGKTTETSSHRLGYPHSSEGKDFSEQLLSEKS